MNYENHTHKKRSNSGRKSGVREGEGKHLFAHAFLKLHTYFSFPLLTCFHGLIHFPGLQTTPCAKIGLSLTEFCSWFHSPKALSMIKTLETARIPLNPSALTLSLPPQTTAAPFPVKVTVSKPGTGRHPDPPAGFAPAGRVSTEPHTEKLPSAPQCAPLGDGSWHSRRERGCVRIKCYPQHLSDPIRCPNSNDHQHQQRCGTLRRRLLFKSSP